MSAAAFGILEEVDPLTVPVIHATRSQVQLRAGQTAEARASAYLALKAIDRTPIFIYLAGFAGLLDTLLELWASVRWSSTDGREVAKLVRRGLAKMRTFALVLPFARPKYWLFKGRKQHLEGRTGRAERCWRKGLAMAEKSGFTWDVGLIHLEMARVLPAPSATRAAHLDEARRSFERVGKPPRPGQSDGAGRLAVYREAGVSDLPNRRPELSLSRRRPPSRRSPCGRCHRFRGHPTPTTMRYRLVPRRCQATKPTRPVTHRRYLVRHQACSWADKPTLTWDDSFLR